MRLAGDFFQAVAQPAHGGNADRALLDLFAQAVDVDLDGVVAHLFAPLAQALHQLLLAHQAAGTLPTRQSVLATSETEDSYERFIHQQLTAAQPRPRLPNYAQVAAALQNAVQEVVAGTQSPEEAAAELLENQ